MLHGTVRLVHHPIGHPIDHVGVGLADQRLGEHGDRADRSLQFV